MLEDCKTAKERWGGVNQIVDRWLQERQDMLVQFCDLGAIKESNDESRGANVRRLCEILVDYTSAGHFEIYDQLAKEGREFGDEDGLEEAARLFATVDSTTEMILDFNDKYQEIDDLSTLEQDLSTLGEALESRFSAEDRMIAVLHTAHRDLVN
jgi:regulator of sigma D